MNEISEWQPFETAPKDGTAILVVDIHDYPEANGDAEVDFIWFECNPKLRGWWGSAGRGPMTAEELHLTHWHALPAAPKHQPLTTETEK